MNLDKYKGKRIVCFDYGFKRIGFAVTDELLITTRPYRTFYNDDKLFDVLKDELDKLKIGLIVVGFPYDEEKEENKLQKEIKEFKKKLESVFKIDVKFQDENYTSIEAEKTMIKSGIKKKNRQIKENKDKIAAAIILKQFLEENA